MKRYIVGSLAIVVLILLIVLLFGFDIGGPLLLIFLVGCMFVLPLLFLRSGQGTQGKGAEKVVPSGSRGKNRS